jgi:cell pole-organizing protein PopZ
MSESKGQHEPSMEEILASIRRIIAEDGEQPGAAPAVATPAPATPAPEAPQPAVATKGEEILELTEVIQEEEHPDPPMPAPAPPQPDPPSVSAATDAERLVSEAAAAASIAALSQIHQLGPTNEKRMSDIPVGEGQRTIEDMVREMLRPLLKEWLDSNLPHLVERVVQEEVSRLVRDVQRR